MMCLCTGCKNIKRWKATTMGKHLYNKGFLENYYLWMLDGEIVGGEASTSAVQPQDAHIFTNYLDTGDHKGDIDANVHMVQDAFLKIYTEVQPTHEEPIGDSSRFFQMLAAAKQPI